MATRAPKPFPDRTAGQPLRSVRLRARQAAFYRSELRKTLQRRYGEQFTELTGPVLPLDKWIGNATGVQALGGGKLQAAAEPERLGGGSALVVHPRR